MIAYRIRLQIAETLQSGGLELIASWLAQPKARIWVDIDVASGANREQSQAQLVQDLAVFGCHPLALQDALDSRQPPKVEAFAQHLLIIYRGVLSCDDTLLFSHQPVNFLVGHNFLLSIHQRKNARVDMIMHADDMWHARTPLGLALTIMRASADVYLQSITQFEGSLSSLEDQLNQQDDERQMIKLNSYRSRLIKLKRLFNYHENITHQLLNDSDYAPWLQNLNAQHEVTDLHDHFERLNSLTQMYYNICSDLLDAFLSLSSYRLNINMRLLTVITTIFIPLSFIVGVYGMNFEYMPELHYRYSYFLLLIFMASIAGAMLWFFKKRQWL